MISGTDQKSVQTPLGILIRFARTRPSLVERIKGRFDVLKQPLNLVSLFGADLFLQLLDQLLFLRKQFA
jgi:hypothetical protein